MNTDFKTPQDAEDAFYDALDDSSLQAMMSTWEDSDAVVCLIPMAPLRIGFQDVMAGWRPLMEGQVKIEVEVHHLHWIETGDLAIHFVEERISLVGQNEKQSPMYATNIYRRGDKGWRMILHQNAPTPPPPGMVPPGMG